MYTSNLGLNQINLKCLGQRWYLNKVSSSICSWKLGIFEAQLSYKCLCPFWFIQYPKWTWTVLIFNKYLAEKKFNFCIKYGECWGSVSQKSILPWHFGVFLRSVELSSSWALGGNLVDNSRLLLSTEYKLKFWAPIYVHIDPKLRISFGNCWW